MSALLNGSGDAIRKFQEFNKLTPEKIQELFRSINKGELVAIAKLAPDPRPE
jgi:predicted SnoaL-like aldol condensation-catalyzing enzyme